MRVLVLGGGVVGVTTAYELQKSGHDVVLVERNKDVGAETSWGNAGMIAPGHSFAWSSPKAPWILLKSLVRKNQALRFRPSSDPRLWTWSAQFLAQCTEGARRPQHDPQAQARRLLPKGPARDHRRRSDRLRPQRPGHPVLLPEPGFARRRHRAHADSRGGRAGNPGARPRAGPRPRAVVGVVRAQDRRRHLLPHGRDGRLQQVHAGPREDNASSAGRSSSRGRPSRAWRRAATASARSRRTAGSSRPTPT